MIRAALVTLCILGCDRSKPQGSEPAHVGLSFGLEQRASRVGCTVIPYSDGGPNSFACVKTLSPCGCTLVLKVTTNEKAAVHESFVMQAKLDMFGCPSDVGIKESFELLDPLVPEPHRASFHKFATTPRVPRDAVQAAGSAVLQTETFDGVHAKVSFGVVTDTPRKIIWLDAYTPAGVQELVPDAPAYGNCEPMSQPTKALVERSGGNVEVDQAMFFAEPLGYCDKHPSNQPPCELDERDRWLFRGDVSGGIIAAKGDWTTAMIWLHVHRDLARGTLVHDEQLGARLFASLVDMFAKPVQVLSDKGVPNANGQVLRARELNEQVATVMRIPTNRSGFMAFLRIAPIEWRDNLDSHINQLYDRDLAALAVRLSRDAADRSSETVEARIKRALQKN